MNNEINLIEGERGKLHVTSDDARTENALMFGIGRKVLNIDNSFEASMTDRNTVRITSGVFYNNGMFIRIDRDTYMDVNIENGLPGTYRNDLICIRYARDIQMQIETASLVVKKGTASETEAIDPTYTVGNVLEFENLDEFPLYRVSLDGVMPTLEPMFVVEDALDNFSIYKEFIEHLQDDNNPHEVTKKQLEIEKVDNTSDLEKPLSTKQKKAIEEAVISANEYTDEKISELSEAAQTTLDALKQIDSIIETKTIASNLSNNENPTIQDSTNAPLIYGKFKGYTLQDGEPTPDNPIEINGLAKDGAIEVKTCGKNLLNHTVTTQTKNGITFTVNNDRSITVNGTATADTQLSINTSLILQKGNYILNGCPANGSASTYRMWANNRNTGENYNDEGEGVSFTIGEETKFIIPIIIFKGVTVSNLTFYPMIRKAEIEDATYEPYTETTTAITTGAPLYEGDYLEVYADGSGKLVRNIGSVTVDITSITTLSNGLVGGIRDVSNKHKSNEEYAYCEKAVRVNSASVTTSGSFYVNPANFVFVGTAEDTLETLKEKYDGAKLIYYLSEPTETPLTAEQVAQFKQLYTFEPVTNVFCDGEVELLYYKNTDNGETVGIVHKKVEASEKAIEDMQTEFGQLPNTFAKKSLYDDTAINVGRLADSVVGNYSTAEGHDTTASGSSSHAEGSTTVASGSHGSHSEGLRTTASNQSSHAEGYSTTASGKYSHAEGNQTTASSNSAHSEGALSKAQAEYSHAEGYGTTASGESAHAEGNRTTASGIYSHAEGYSTTALSCQHAQGHFNDTTLATALYVNGRPVINGTGTHTAFVIGNGISESSVSNAFRVNYDGVAIGKSSFASSGADYAEYFEWQDGNTENEDRVGHFVTFADGRFIKKANEGDYILGIVSGMPCVIGNNDECWMKQFEMDIWGRFIYETHTETDEETGEEKEYTFYKVNPDYDATKPYTHREERPEWSAIGMFGVLSVYDDGTCQVNGYCKCGNNGIATAAERGTDTYRVLERINDNVIKVALK